MRTITIPFQITKVDEEQRRVWGVATSEALDSQGDVLDYEASKKAVTDWMKTGNIREMHDGKKAVGKAFDAQFDDVNKSITVGSYISRSADGENTWIKVQEGVLTGYSVGGQVNKTIVDKAKDAVSGVERTINRVTDWDMSELSLVDNPANPEAQIVMVKSKDGESIDYIDMEKFLTAFDKKLSDAISKNDLGIPVAWWVNKYQNDELTTEAIRKYKVEQLAKMDKKDYSDKERNDMADKGQALPDGSFPIKTKADLANAIKAYGRAKNKSKAKSHIITRAKDLGASDMLPEDWNKSQEPTMTKAQKLQKDFMGTARVVDIACQLTWFLESEMAEGDTETVDAVNAALVALKAAAASELDEVGEEEAGEFMDVIEYGLKAVDLKKTGAAVVGGDPRNQAAATVSVVTGNDPVKGGTPIARPIYHADGSFTIVTKSGEKIEMTDEMLEKLTPNTVPLPPTPPRQNNPAADQPGAKRDGDQADDDSEEDTDGKADAASEQVTSDGNEPPAGPASNPSLSDSADGSADAPTPANNAGGGTATVQNAEPAAPTGDTPKKKDDKVSTSDSADGSADAPTEEEDEEKSNVATMQKSISTTEDQLKDLAKAQGLEKALSDLTTLVKGNLEDFGKRLQKIENLPQPVKTQASYMKVQEVEKGRENEAISGGQNAGKTETEIVDLFKRADYLAAHPSDGSPQERGELFRTLYKFNREDYAHLLK